MPGQHITDQQASLFMKHHKTCPVETAAAKAGFSANTGYRLQRDPRPPSQKKPSRGSCRADPLAGIFDQEVVPMLEEHPQLRPVAIFEELQRRHPLLKDGVRRTLERRVKQWRTEHGPDPEVIFPQSKEPGRMGISDFTPMGRLDITVDGQPFDHRLYHFRLPWSGFTHANIVPGGESFPALSEGLQDALWSLGGAPKENRTDSLSAAFKNLSKSQAEDQTSRYRDLCEYYQMTPTRNNRGVAHENGAIESSHGHLKRAIADALMLRGSKNFARVDEYRQFLTEIVGRINARHDKAIQAEQKHLQALPPQRSPSYEQQSVRVTTSSGFTLRGVFYTVPPKLIGQRLSVHLYPEHLELFLGGTFQLELARHWKRPNQPTPAVVDYRHVIKTLKIKPGALLHLTYRNELFPRQAFRHCFDQALAELGERPACRLLVNLLALAYEQNCEAALAEEIKTCLSQGKLPQLDQLRTRFAPAPHAVPEVNVAATQLSDYSPLLHQESYS